MNKPRVQLLAFPGCPNVGAARQVIQRALDTVGLPAEFEDINVHDPGTRAELQNWASPTILVNGQDVAGGAEQQGTGCRIYEGEGNAPALEQVIAALRAAVEPGDG